MVTKRIALAGPDVWLGKEMEARSDWIHVLAKDEIEDLQGAVRGVRSAGLAMYAVTKKDFPLPVLSHRFGAISKDLEHGCGVANIRGIPTDTFSMEDLRWVLWGIGTHL